MDKKSLSALIGRIAVTDTALNLRGTALIDDIIFEVETEGESVEAGRGVKVTRIRGKRIIVTIQAL